MIRLRRLLDLPLLVILMAITTLLMIVPSAYALVLKEFSVARAFFYSGIILFILTAMIAIATASHRPKHAAQSQLASVILAYLVVPVLLAVPVHQAMPGLRFSEAWFEMLSCFTTTGATLFADPAIVADPVHLWRAMAGWLGGYFTLVMLAAVLAPIGLGGIELMGNRGNARSEGGGQVTRIADPSQRIIHVSAAILPVYAALTLLLWVGLLVGGDSALTALCHAMGTLSTSGISPTGGLATAVSGRVGEVMIFVGLAFAVTRQVWFGTGLADRRLNLWQDPELRLALAIVAIVTGVMIVYLMLVTPQAAGGPSVTSLVRSGWAAAFTALSFLTTTGFQSGAWPETGPAGLLLLGLAMVGGGVATTAGGVKLLRVYALLRHGERELERIVHPHSIGGHGPVARRLRREGAYLAWIFFMIFGLSIAGVTAALTLAGLGFHEAMVLAIAALTTTGQLAGVAGDGSFGYAGLGDAAMAILGTAMVLGRLEILAVFAMIGQNVWVR